MTMATPSPAAADLPKTFPATSMPQGEVVRRGEVEDMRRVIVEYRKKLRGPQKRRAYWDVEDMEEVYEDAIIPPPQLSRDAVALVRQEHREEEQRQRLLAHRELSRRTWWMEWKLHQHRQKHPEFPICGRLYTYDEYEGPRATCPPCPPGWTVYFFPDGIIFEPTGYNRRHYMRPRCLRDSMWCAGCGLTSLSRQWNRIHGLTRRRCYPLDEYPDPEEWAVHGLVCRSVVRMREGCLALSSAPASTLLRIAFAPRYWFHGGWWGGRDKPSPPYLPPEAAAGFPISYY